ncbi:hypothetical protein [Asanoa sp. NPDC050611]|uniref:hypothetical protein n=1 Tax=Asanoa sp. NPDC050611 TaxID=3157098 RepID=UPI0033D007D3
MRTDSFLRHSATYLKAEVSADTIRQAKQLREDQAREEYAELTQARFDRFRRLGQIHAESELIRRRLVDATEKYSAARARFDDAVARDAPPAELYRMSNAMEREQQLVDVFQTDLDELRIVEKATSKEIAEIDAMLQQYQIRIEKSDS